MPFTISGDWIPETPSAKPSKPIKVLKEKRRSSYVTVIMHIPYENPQLKILCAALKKRLGCGGSVKEEQIELQGDQIDAVKIYFKEQGIKIS